MPLAARLAVRSTYELIREMASKDPERTAITLLHGIHQTANLLADLGVESGDVIALLLPKLLESHLLLWRGQVAGIVCPIHPHLPVEQTIALLGATKAKVLVAPGPQVDQELWQKAEEVRHQVESLIHLFHVRGPGKEQDAVYAFAALLGDYPSDYLYNRRELSPDDIAVYFQTRNAVGEPGFMPLTHGNLLYVAWRSAPRQRSDRRRYS